MNASRNIVVSIATAVVIVLAAWVALALTANLGAII